MKFLKSLLKYLGFYVLGVTVSSLVVFTALSYFAVDQLSKAFDDKPVDAKNAHLLDQPLNPNIKEIILIGRTYVDELDLFDSLYAQIKAKNPPALCEVLCKPISIDQEKLAQERTPYLLAYFKQNQTLALQDPLFRQRVEEIGFLSELFPSSLRSILREVAATRKAIHDRPSKISLAFKLQWHLLKEISGFYLRWGELKQKTTQLKKHRELLQSCALGSPAKKVLADCQAP